MTLAVLLVSCEAIPSPVEPTATSEPAPTKTPKICPPDCWGLNWAGADLRGADLHGAVFTQDNLSINLSGADLTEADLSGAYMPQAYLLRADLPRANLRGANLQNADIRGTDLSGADFSNADLRGADLRPVVEDTNMDGTILYGADLRGADLRGAYLNSALADTTTQFDEKWQLVFEINEQGGNGLSLDATDLSSTDLSGANLQQTSLRESDLRRAYLSGTDLEGADLREANISEANLSGANLSESIVKDANLSWADLTEADLSNTTLNNADLRIASLNGAILYRADLSNANLRGADITGAVLDEADLSGAIVSEEQLSRAQSLKGTTVPPLTLSSASAQIVIEVPSSSLSPEVVTTWEAIDAEMRAKYSEVHSSCSSCVPGPSGSNCTKYLWTKYVTRSEWTELFPDTHFFLVATHRIENAETNMYGYDRSYFIIAQQDGERYEIRTFDNLLHDNGVVITDENRELVARSAALMTLANFLEEEIILFDLSAIDEGGRGSFERYNYALIVWTKINGLKVRYRYSFEQEGLKTLAYWPVDYETGDYTDMPVAILPHPDLRELRFQ